MTIPNGAIWTVGHSTRSIDEFVSVLVAHEVELIADVRRFPASRRLPHFNAAELEKSLERNGISYKWLPSLGGRRSPIADSPNGGWTNAAFRGYADHTATEEFADGFEDLMMLAAGLRTAVMCAELLWWRCHRRIISDVLLTQGFDVVHIRDAEHSERHKLVAPAKIVEGEVRYPQEEPAQLGLLI